MVFDTYCATVQVRRRTSHTPAWVASVCQSVMLQVGCSLVALIKQKQRVSCQARKYLFCHFIGRSNRLNGASYHQVGFHCIVSWPSGHLLSFRSGHLQFPGFFPTDRNAPLPSLAFRIQQKVPRNKTYTNESFQQLAHETCSGKQKNKTKTKPHLPECLRLKLQNQDLRRGASLRFPYQLPRFHQRRRWSRCSRCHTCRVAICLEAVWAATDERERTCWLQDPPASVNHSPHGWVLGQAGDPHPRGPGCAIPPKRVPPVFPCPPHHYKQVYLYIHGNNLTKKYALAPACTCHCTNISMLHKNVFGPYTPTNSSSI